MVWGVESLKLAHQFGDAGGKGAGMPDIDEDFVLLSGFFLDEEGWPRPREQT